MSLAKLLGALTNQEGEANPNAGAVLIDDGVDDDGKPISHYEKTDAQGNVTKISSKDAEKTGTGALKRPGFGQKLLNPDSANRIAAINSQYNALPAEEQQRYNTSLTKTKDGLRHAFSSTGQPVDEAQIDSLARGMVNNIYSTNLRTATGEMADIKNGVPQSESQLRKTTIGSEQTAEEKYQQAGGPAKSGAARASMASYQGNRAGMEEGLLSQEDAQRRLQYRLDTGSLNAAVNRQPIVEGTKTQDALNAYVRANKLDPKIIQRDIADTEAYMGRAATMNEKLRIAEENALRQQQDIVPLQQGVEANKLLGEKEAGPNIRKAIVGQSAQQALLANQPPPAELMRGALYSANPDAIANGNFRNAYSPLGTNPYYQNPMLMKLNNIDAMSARIGGGGGGGITIGANGRPNIPANMLGQAQPITASIAPANITPTPISGGQTNAAMPRPTQSAIRPSIAATPPTMQSASGLGPLVDYLLHGSKDFQDYLKRTTPAQ